jgi:lysophospholipase L1-like esterase
MKPTILHCCLVSLCFALPADAKPKLPESVPIVFLGDSITHGGLYIDYLESYLVTRFPEKHYELLNLGLPSETVSGLSEPGHAGGAFPRPDLHERLDRILQKVKPRLVVACYGMNDGIYYPFGQARFEAYQRGIQKLVQKVRDAHSEILLLTPPVFDPLPLKGRTLPVGLKEYRQPFQGYDDVLGIYSEWLLSQRSRGWAVIDVHGPMKRHLLEMRSKNPEYILAGDGVHANAVGHLLMAKQLFAGLGLPKIVDEVAIDLRTKKAKKGHASHIERGPNLLSFDWITRRPMPVDSQWNAVAMEMEQFPASHNLWVIQVRNLGPGEWHLNESENNLWTGAASALSKGLNLGENPSMSVRKEDANLLKMIRRKQKLLTDSWLAEIGHKRPGMSKGVSIAEATRGAAELDKEIGRMVAPCHIAITVSH